MSLLLLSIALMFMVMTWTLGPTARLVPMVVAFPAVGLLLLQSCLDLFPRLSRKVAPFERLRLHDVEALRTRGAAMEAGSEGSLASALIWIGAAPLLIYLLGFALATPLYATAFIRFRAGESWIRSLAIGAAISLVISLLLALALGRPVIDGILVGWFFKT